MRLEATKNRTTCYFVLLYPGARVREPGSDAVDGCGTLLAPFSLRVVLYSVDKEPHFRGQPSGLEVCPESRSQRLSRKIAVKNGHVETVFCRFLAAVPAPIMHSTAICQHHQLRAAEQGAASPCQYLQN